MLTVSTAQAQTEYPLIVVLTDLTDEWHFFFFNNEQQLCICSLTRQLAIAALSNPNVYPAGRRMSAEQPVVPRMSAISSLACSLAQQYLIYAPPRRQN
jgi:hypothetical protein